MNFSLSLVQNRFAHLLLLLLLSMSASHQAIAQTGVNCSDDLMKTYQIHIPHAEFYRSEVPTESSQLLCRSVYKVPGQHARTVETLLVKKFGMGKLIFLCCGWSPKGGKNGAFKRSHRMADGGYAYYSIQLNSEETLERKQWSKIAYFYVTLEIYSI